MLILALRKFRTAITPALLAYRTSGDITGDYRSSVSYAAISFSAASPITQQNGGKD
jgi:AmmeMemoRadiSam system protein B